MSAYFLHQPSKTPLKIHPSISSKTTTQQSTPRASYEITTKTPIVSSKEITPSEEKKEKSAAKKLLKAIQQRWKEHHESVQGIYDLYYGQGTSTGRALGNPFATPKKI